MKALKYLTVLTLPALSFLAVHLSGWWTFLPLFYTFGLIPLVELLVRPDASNLSADEEALLVEDRFFDMIIYFSAILHLVFITYFFVAGHYINDGTISTVGNIFTLGLMCGIFGINIAHELGHRKALAEQFLAKVLLLTSLYMHFFIEHNRGHHRYVSTERDPASAPRSMSLYRFWLRSIVGCYISAWKLEQVRLQKKNLPIWRNNMWWFQLFQIALCLVLWLLWGKAALVTFLIAATIGVLLLETVNYIEHYGLRRKRLPSGNYERAMPRHSWNSNHLLGRLLLFELSRHSDHHYLASRKYQVLKHHDKSPQLPTGYPGMMILSFFPPLWFRIIDTRLHDFEKAASAQ